ncbi:MAG TPA: NAD(P)/FAD-dependent oxidoreductase [Methylomirabilota bacterium]|nr:NAD(P)/FAD-dependent oxidoreductase [Methylomirabilota bacterium]
MDKQYDLVVIGTGTASGAASRCREAGWKVAVVDSRPVGGTCALRGCRPKKMLVAGAEAVHAARDMVGRGVKAPGAELDWPALMRFKRSETDHLPQTFTEGYARAGIDVLRGRAHFVAPTALAVNGDRLEARHVLIAAGARPAPLGVPGEDLVATSDRFLELDTLPRQIVFVGGGYISFEFAHVAARAGAEVTILHRGPRPLEGFDADLVGLLVRRTEELGIRVALSTAVSGFERRGNGVAVLAQTGGRAQRFEADLAIHSAGRVPDLDDLDLETGGITREKRGVSVNQYLQSVSNPAVYAAGDAAASGAPPLTPKAGHDTDVVGQNLLEGNHRTPNYEAIAGAVFTVPALASVGLTEEAARARGLRFRARWEDTSSWFSSKRVGETASGYKTLVEEATGRILGAHLLGPHAPEIINIFAVAMRFGIRAEELKQVLFAYPTSASDVPFML